MFASLLSSLHELLSLLQAIHAELSVILALLQQIESETHPLTARFIVGSAQPK